MQATNNDSSVSSDKHARSLPIMADTERLCVMQPKPVAVAKELLGGWAERTITFWGEAHDPSAEECMYHKELHWTPSPRRGWSPNRGSWEEPFYKSPEIDSYEVEAAEREMMNDEMIQSCFREEGMEAQAEIETEEEEAIDAYWKGCTVKSSK